MDSNQIRISGLTLVEKWFLNLIWSIKTTEEMNELKASLHPLDLEVVEKLQSLILMEYIDLELDKKDSFPYVKRFLEKYKTL